MWKCDKCGFGSCESKDWEMPTECLEGKGEHNWRAINTLPQIEEYIENNKNTNPNTAFNTQVGGNHYTKLAIQPMEYSMKNNLNALQHTIVKYITRYKDKNGLDDLLKAKHCIDMLIELEYKDKK